MVLQGRVLNPPLFLYEVQIALALHRPSKLVVDIIAFKPASF
jgi:hypothetical protein